MFFLYLLNVDEIPLTRGASCSEVSLVPKAHMGVTLHALLINAFMPFYTKKCTFVNTACKFLAIRENGWDDRFVPSHV